ncbi:T9SS type A sorting domain-containing protein [Hymenobacter rubidus]|uniref:T9SS type A sorting domain-containing protein n=1 Tax=Hymenobacter rubidus TaxID=1441626 RepID=UPI00191DD588|nr:T9SS type A sorting domain-containing protein [Hymenobacter rubidus]
MKNPYRILALALAVGSCQLSAHAQQLWRPFRPGLIYSYAATPVTSSSEYYTLRVDSAYATAGGDSVYAFNRRLRTTAVNSGGGGPVVKSRNNLFGAMLRWRPGQASYTLEALAQTGVQAPVSLMLFPRAAVGSSWVASASPAQTATLVSRSWQTISPGVQDTVAVISIAGATIQTVRLSRRYGLLAGPQWLGGATGGQLEQPILPARFEQSLYSSTRLFDMQPGDEFGYNEEDPIAVVQCYDSKVLRRVTRRQLTSDSLIITYLEQTRYERYGYPGAHCNGPAQVTYYPIVVKRWALALSGNVWQSMGTPLPLGALRLLTGEYVNGPVPGSGPVTSPSYLFAGLPIAGPSSYGCSTGRTVSYIPFYPLNGGSSYGTGVDYFAWNFTFSPGMGPSFERDYNLIYSRKTVNGVTTICGSPLAFVNLLATRAEQAAAIASLAPNPAAETATLTLAQPARPGHTLRLTDALGRPVWSTPVATGQTAVAVPLAGQPAGLYLLHLNGPDGTSVSWKLVHE